MELRIVRKPAFHVVGMAGRFTPATNSRIPALWGQFAPRMHVIPHRRGAETFGLCVEVDPGAGDEFAFTYLAAVEVDRLDDVPDGMVGLTVPAHR